MSFLIIFDVAFKNLGNNRAELCSSVQYYAERHFENILPIKKILVGNWKYTEFRLPTNNYQL